jgi:glycosyltransferase 2 family protein
MSRKSLFFLCLAAIGAFVAYRLLSPGFDWSLFLTSLWNVHPVWLAASILATMLTYVARAFRWQVLLHPLKSIALGPLISVNVLGFSAIFLLGRPGEFVRPLWLARLERIPLTASLATIIIERVLDTLMLLILFGLALLVAPLPSAAAATVTAMKNAAWLMVAGAGAGIVFLFFFRSKIEWIVSFVPFDRARSLLRSFSSGLSFLDRSRSLALALMHSVVVWIVIVLQFWTMLLGMNFRFSLAAATLVMVGAAVGSVAQLPGIGGGFQALYIFCMTTFFAVPAEKAFASAMIAWISQFIPTVLAGGWYMISHGLSLKDLRTVTAD